MRKFHILMATAGLFMLASCSKTLQVDPVSFEVTTASTNYNPGDNVDFIFRGQPDMITFYSGESGHNYEYRDRTIADGKPQMQFDYFGHYGPQNNTLHLLISKDFDGTYDAASIENATWTDISDEVTFGLNSTLPSGVIDLSPYVEEGKIFYFAFKYIGSHESTQKTWTITNFKIDLQLDDGSVAPVANMVTAGWSAVNIKNDDKVWKISATQLQMAGGGGGTPDNEDWLITSPLNPNKVSPDRGVAIKNITNNLPDYSYVYAAPGSYNPVFVAVNATRDGEKSAVKQMKITIAP